MHNKKVLVYHIGNLGDTVASVPTLRLIRRKYGPDAEISLLYDHSPVEVVNATDVLRGTGLVDQFLRYRTTGGRFGKLSASVEAWWRVATKRFNTVIYLMQSERTEKHVARDKLFFTLCGIPEKLGFDAFPKSFLYPRDANGTPQVVEHEALRRANRLIKYGFPALSAQELDDPFLSLPAAEVQKAQVWLGENRRYPDRILVGYCPGSKMQAKIWPRDRFVEIGRRLLADDRFEIVVLGGPADVELAQDLIAQWGDGLNAAGKFSVLGSAALLKHCRFAFATDSGPMHLGASVGTPCVALFSGVDYPGRFHPLGRNHVLLRHPVKCAGCRLQVCPLEDHPCMNGITVDQVWTGVEQLCESLDVHLGSTSRIINIS